MSSTKHTASELISLAEKWQAQANEESGKTAENGWLSWELYAAEKRREHCELKRDMCLTAARNAAT